MTTDLFEIGYAPENLNPPWAWAADHIRLRGSPYGDRFVPEETPWLKEPLETLADNRIREIVLMCCVQGGKTVSQQAGICWALANQPDPTMFVMQTDQAVGQFARQRLIPNIESCEILRAQLPVDRNKRSTKEIHLANATLLLGAANESTLRSHSIRWMFGDECSAWDPGRMDQARARTTRFWNRRHYFASTPLLAGTDFDNAFKAGDQRHYHLTCPSCRGLVYLESDNFAKLLTWDDDEETHPKGLEWNFTKVRATVRMVCPHCSGKFVQTEALWRKMLEGAKYVVRNPNAPDYLVSCRFNSFVLPPSVKSWADLVEGWLRAKDEEKKGNLAPLKEFITLVLAEVWDERKFLTVTYPDFNDYDVDQEWRDAAGVPKEKFRAITVDCQNQLAKFYADARQWAADGSSRLLAFAELYTFAEIEEFREKWKVKRHMTFLDCGYEHLDVWANCVRYGWGALRGEGRDNGYGHTQNGRTVHRPYSPVRVGDPRCGKGWAGHVHCAVFGWSNRMIKDLLFNLKSGRGVEWIVCNLGPEMNEFYGKGLDSERRRTVIGKNGVPTEMYVRIRQNNHPLDCEAMQVVVACMAKLFSADPADETAPAAAGLEEAT
jgi:hypothetical protein